MVCFRLCGTIVPHCPVSLPPHWIAVLGIAGPSSAQLCFRSVVTLRVWTMQLTNISECDLLNLETQLETER